MKEQLHQRQALDVPRFDVVNARDVQEVILVVIRQEAFHLRRVHAAVRLADINDRQVEAGEDVHRHPPECHGDPKATPTRAIITVRGPQGQ